MEKIKNIKIWLGLAYIVFLGIFLYFLLTKISLEELTSYNFLKSNSETLMNFKNSNLVFSSLVFILFGIIWISVLQGFGSPLGLICGYVFGPYLGTLIFSFTFALGASVTFIVANYFFKEFIKEKIQNNFKSLNNKIKENQFFAVALLRFLGGIPIQIQNLIPVLFDIKLKFYFLGTLIGVVIQALIVCSLGSAIEKKIYESDSLPKIQDILKSQEIYLPILAIIFLFILTFILRKLFFKR
tara:strand:- start:1151 stop:1873 length:723 start_codon:yes stop_codon:yes gene_type:complete